MAFYCIDYNNGSNVTGDGTASLPWQTIEHGETQINGGTGYVLGDEMRIAGSTKSALLDTVTVTGNSFQTAVFSTTTDLTGTLSVGDYVQLVSVNAFPGDIVEKVSWYVSLISASSITIFSYRAEYTLFSTSSYLGTPTFDIYKITDTVTFDVNGGSGYYLDKPNQIATSFDPFSDSVTISGGWDPATFTSKTAYGKTVFGRTGTFQATGGYPYGATFYPSIGLNGLLFKDMVFARVFGNYWAVSGQWNGGCNWTNISTSGPLIETHTGLPLASTYNRIFDGCAISSGAFDCEVNGPKSEFKNSWIWGYNNIPQTRFQTQNYNQIVDFSNNVIVATGNGTEWLDYYFYTIVPGAGYNPGQMIEIDFATTTTLSKDGNWGNFLASGNYSPAFGLQDITVPSAFLGNWPTTGGFSYIMDNAWSAGLSITTDNVDALPIWKPGLDPKGAWLSSATDTTTGITWSVLGGVYSRLNTLDKDTGINCIELKPMRGIIEGNVVAFKFLKGNTIDVTIKAKIKGSTASVSPTLKVIGNNMTEGAAYLFTNNTEAMTLTSGSGFTNTAWQTNTYTLTNAFSAINNNLFFAAFEVYTNVLPNTDSLLIDEVTWTIT